MGESLDKIIEIIEKSKIILAMGHQKTDDDALFSAVFFKKYIEVKFPDKKCFALADSQEALSDDLTNVTTKYKELGIHHVTDPLGEEPDLVLLLDSQFTRPDLLVPQIKQNEEITILDIKPLKKICLDHHISTGNNGYEFCLIEGSKYSSTASLIIDILEDDIEIVKKILGDNNQILASLGYEGIYQDTGGMEKEVMLETDHKAAQFLSYYMDHAKMHKLHQPKKNPQTRKMLGEAFSKEELDRIGNIANYVFVPTQINKADDAKLAEVANGILGCEESRGLGVVVAGIVHDSEEDKYTLGFKVRSDKPKTFSADKIVKILSQKGGGDKFKAGGVVDLKFFKHSTGSEPFQTLIRREVRDRLLGSELNEAAEKPSKQSLTKPTELGTLVKQDRESDHLAEILKDSLNDMSFRSQKKFVSYFIDKGLTEDDVNALLSVNDLYHSLMGKAELKKTQASLVYGLVNQGFEPYIVGIISVKHDEKQSELDTAEQFAEKLFGTNISTSVCLKEQNNQRCDSIIVRVPVPYIEYKTNSPELLDCVKYEISEREKILGEKEAEIVESVPEGE